MRQPLRKLMLGSWLGICTRHPSVQAELNVNELLDAVILPGQGLLENQWQARCLARSWCLPE
jgi:hypothetical protein